MEEYNKCMDCGMLWATLEHFIEVGKVTDLMFIHKVFAHYKIKSQNITFPTQIHS